MWFKIVQRAFKILSSPFGVDSLSLKVFHSLNIKMRQLIARSEWLIDGMLVTRNLFRFLWFYVLFLAFDIKNIESKYPDVEVITINKNLLEFQTNWTVISLVIWLHILNQLKKETPEGLKDIQSENRSKILKRFRKYLRYIKG